MRESKRWFVKKKAKKKEDVPYLTQYDPLKKFKWKHYKFIELTHCGGTNIQV